MNDPDPSLSRRLLRLPIELVVALYIVLDALFAPLCRPILRWLSSWRLFQRLARGIAALPPYVILVLLFVPFGIAESAKVYAVLLMTEDHVRAGVTMFIGAYIVSIFVCERIFHAGRDQLMTIGWLKRLFEWVTAIRTRLFEWFRRTAVWHLVTDLRARGHAMMVRFRTILKLPSRGSFGWR